MLALLALVLLAGCGPTYTHWENAKYPRPLTAEQSTEFERAKYECQRENTYSSAYVNRYYGTSGTEVNWDMAMACMKARGWYPVENK